MSPRYNPLLLFGTILLNGMGFGVDRPSRSAVRPRGLMCERLESREMLSAYYVDSVSGNDSYDGFAGAYVGGTTGPWKTIAKVNAQTFGAGDSILFKCGDTWREQLTVSSSGSSDLARITYGSYGTGENPVISGADVVSGNWTVYSGNVWSVALDPSVTAVSQLFVDDVRQTLAKTNGWSTIDATTDNIHLYDTILTQPDNYWVGATLQIRDVDWAIETRTITGSSSANRTVTWDTPLSWGAVATTGWGYYLENKLELVDTVGEWYFDATSHTLYLQVAPGDNPNNHQIEYSTRTYGVFAYSRNYVTISDINVEKARQGITVANSNHTEILGNTVANCATSGITCYMTGYTDLLIDGNVVTGVDAGYGINSTCQNQTISNNAITDIAADTISPRTGWGLRFGGENSIVTQNTISDISYNGIIKQAVGSATISHNTISRCLLILADGGGIYSGSAYLQNVVIKYNRIDSVLGNHEGTPKTGPTGAMGIYLDESPNNGPSYGAIVRYNVVSNCDRGINLHQVRNVSYILNNTLYNIAWAICFVEGAENQMFGNVVRNNICYTTSDSQQALRIRRYSTSTNPIGTFDYNIFYSSGSATNQAVRYERGSTTYYTLAQWQAKTGPDSGNDAHTLAMNPLFVNLADGDFHLATTSPAIDAGVDVGQTQDFDGVSVPINGTPDIGAYEYCGPFHAWRFDGNLKDSIGNNHGSPSSSGVAGYGTGLVGRGIELSGSGYIQTSFGNGETSTSPRTYTMWVNTDTSTAAKMCLVQSTTGINTRAYVANLQGYWRMGIGASSWDDGNTAKAVTPGWHFIAMVFDGANAKLYVDGDYVYQKPSGNFTFNQGLSIGGSSLGYLWDGKIDDVQVFRTALSEETIAEMYTMRMPEAWWDLDESGAATTAADASGNGHTGTLIGTGTTWTTGLIGNAINLSGAGYVQIPDSDYLENTSKLTISAWVCPTTQGLDGSPRAIISKRSGASNNDNAYSLFFYQGKLYVDIGGVSAGHRFSSSTTFNAATDANQWYHVAVTFDGSQTDPFQRLKVYINGVAEDIAANVVNTSIPNSSAPLLIGILNAGYSTSFVGKIDDVRLYRSVLTPDAITELYVNVVAEAWWKLDGNLEDSIGDRDGSGSVTYVAGQVNQGVDFTGTGYVTTPYGQGEGSTTPRTYTLWVNTDIPTGSGMCLVQSTTGSNTRAYVAHLQGYWRMGIGASSWDDGNTAKAVTTGWHFIALVFDGANAKLYVDGDYVYQKASGNFTFNQGLSIGGSSLGYLWDGRIDEVRVYRSALSPDLINELYASGAGSMAMGGDLYAMAAALPPSAADSLDSLAATVADTGDDALDVAIGRELFSRTSGPWFIDPRALERVDLFTAAKRELDRVPGRGDLDSTLDSLVDSTLRNGIHRKMRLADIDAILADYVA